MGAGLVLSACCFMNFSLAPEPPGVLLGIFVLYVEILNWGKIWGWKGVGEFGLGVGCFCWRE